MYRRMQRGVRVSVRISECDGGAVSRGAVLDRGIWYMQHVCVGLVRRDVRHVDCVMQRIVQCGVRVQCWVDQRDGGDMSSREVQRCGVWDVYSVRCRAVWRDVGADVGRLLGSVCSRSLRVQCGSGVRPVRRVVLSRVGMWCRVHQRVGRGVRCRAVLDSRCRELQCVSSGTIWECVGRHDCGL